MWQWWQFGTYQAGSFNRHWKQCACAWGSTLSEQTAVGQQWCRTQCWHEQCLNYMNSQDTTHFSNLWERLYCHGFMGWGCVGSHLPTLPLIMPHVPSGSSSANIQTVRSNTICRCHSRNTLIILEMTGKNKAPSLVYIKVQVGGAESQSVSLPSDSEARVLWNATNYAAALSTSGTRPEELFFTTYKEVFIPR
jgi:hypothetical protein